MDESSLDPKATRVHRITAERLESRIRRYASGVLVDLGYGVKPYAALTRGLVTKHIGVDHPATVHHRENIDVFATCYETGLPDAMADTVLCTAVLEHLERPQDAICEMHRILKPGGYLILGAPLFWHLHEEPRDFCRYTSFGLTHMFETAGFQVVEVYPMSGFIVTFSQELCYFLEGYRRKVIRYPVHVFQFLLQWAAYRAHRLGLDRARHFTWSYLAVGKKLANEQSSCHKPVKMACLRMKGHLRDFLLATFSGGCRANGEGPR